MLTRHPPVPPLPGNFGAMTVSPDTPPAAEAIASVEEQLGALFVRFRSRIRTRAALVHPELQPTGYMLLTTLIGRGPIHGRRLAEILELDKSAVSRQVTAMERLGLIDREPDPADGRAYFLAASAAAKERVALIRRADQEELRARLRKWDAAEVPLFAELLARINEIDSRDDDNPDTDDNAKEPR